MKVLFRRAIGTLARTFDFSGRSDRAEFVTYLVLSQLPVVIAALATAWMEPGPAIGAVMLCILVLVTAPFFALCARRFHDSGRSGWWSAPLLALVARTLVLDTLGLAAGWPVRSAIEAVLSYVDWLLILPAVAAFVALVALPRKGPGNETTGAEGSAPAV